MNIARWFFLGSPTSRVRVLACMLMRVRMEAGAQPLVPRRHPPHFWGRISPWLWAHRKGSTVWPAKPKNSPASAAYPVVGFKTPPMAFLHGFWEVNSDLWACKASTWPTEPSRDPVSIASHFSNVLVDADHTCLSHFRKGSTHELHLTNNSLILLALLSQAPHGRSSVPWTNNLGSRDRLLGSSPTT